MVAPSSPNESETPSKRESDALLERHGFRRGQLFAGKYRLEGLLGEGGMGLVLLATHVDLKRTVAIKVVRSELARNDEIVERLLAEAQAAAFIRSEHVTRVLDLGRLDSGTPYIVLEYLQGRDLAVLLDEHGPLPIETAVDFILQVCDALAEAHAAGIIHRDLKPENLFLTHRTDGTPVVKLIDFGISKNLSARDRRAALTNPAQLVGSPYYMAPEQMRGARVVDARADIWALGVVLYELCTGQTPFAADSIPGVCHLVMQENPTPPRTFAPDMPEELEAVILCCLEKDPNERYADVAEFAAALAGFGTPEAIAYADRVQRVLAAPTAPERLPGAFSSSPELQVTLDRVTPDAPTQVGVSQHSWRTPVPLAATRNGSHVGRRSRRSRRRRFAWLTMTAGVLFGATAAAAVVWLPTRFRVDPTAADLAAMRSLPEPAAAAELPAALATPTIPSAPPPTSAAPEFLAPEEPATSEPAPDRSAQGARRRNAPRPWWPARGTASRSAQTAPTQTAELSTTAGVPSTQPATPAAAATTTASTPASTKPKRTVLDPWDRKSFGGRR